MFRLVDQNGNDVGARVEGLLLSNGGTVCDDGFTDNSADAICRELDFIGGRSWRNGNLWSSFQSSFNITLDDVSCSSGELSMCTYSFEDNCGHGEDIFLECDAVGKCIVHHPESFSKNPYSMLVENKNNQKNEIEEKKAQQEFRNAPQVTILLCACKILE